MALDFMGSSQNKVSKEMAPHVYASAELTLVVIKSKMETDGLRTRIMKFVQHIILFCQLGNSFYITQGEN